MRLSTITNWAYGATVILTLVSGVTMLAASNAQQQERYVIDQRYQLDQATAELDSELYALTEHSRQYLNVGDPTYLTIYNSELERLAPIEDRLRHLEETGLTVQELAILNDALNWTDALHDEQAAALEAFAAGDTAMARKILFGPEYQRELDNVEAALGRFRDRLDQRIARQVDDAVAVSRMWRAMSETTIAVTGLLFLFVLFFVIRQRVLRPVVKLSDVVTRLARQDYDAEPPELRQIDEIGDMAHAIRVFRENGLERQRLEAERTADRAMRDMLWRMTERMQGCDSMQDLTEVIRRFVPEIVPCRAGRLYVLDRQRNAAVEACSWANPQYSAAEFPANACWAMRRGQPHHPAGGAIDVPCGHLEFDAGAIPDTLCLPLIAQRETLGMLYLEPHAGAGADGPFFGKDTEEYIGVLTENISLALSNLQLREALSDMAMADPLTGLSNRRRLDTVHSMLLADVKRAGRAIGCLMVDVDHFKRFNDTYGHAAGDAVLKELAGVLNASVREGEFVFRYGGEEFMMLFPDLDTGGLLARAEMIRQRVAALTLSHEGQDLGSITVSIGAAASPECPYDALAGTADAALLKAKAQGRNCVVASDPAPRKTAVGE